jgi:hypothetical protein
MNALKPPRNEEVTAMAVASSWMMNYRKREDQFSAEERVSKLFSSLELVPERNSNLSGSH